MSKQQTTRSHTIPQMYLKNFANKKGQVWTYSLKDHRYFKQNIKDACVKNKTYEFTKNKVDNILENNLAEKEAIWGPLLYNIINGKTKLTRKEIEDLLRFCFIQFFRTSQGRKQLVNILRNNKRYKNIKKIIPANCEIENFVLSHTIDLVDKIIAGDIVTEIKIYKTKNEIYISDTPIIINESFSAIYCPLTSNSYIVLKLISKTTILHYQNPITIQLIKSYDYNFLDFNISCFDYKYLDNLNYDFSNFNNLILMFSVVQGCEQIFKCSKFNNYELFLFKDLPPMFYFYLLKEDNNEL